MKAIRKLLAMALVIVMVLSMSTFVFATEEIQSRSCAHDLVPRQEKVRFFYQSPTECGYYIDVYEQCQLCGYTYISRGNMPLYRNHFLEGGSDYCWQCCHAGCRLP